MEQLGLGEISRSTKLGSWSRGELENRYLLVEEELLRFVRENYELRSLKLTDEQLKLVLEEQLQSLRNDKYGSSSERYKKPPKPEGPKEPPKPRVKKPSERYPNIPVKPQLITQTPAPHCPCCGEVMTDSG